MIHRSREQNRASLEHKISSPILQQKTYSSVSYSKHEWKSAMEESCYPEPQHLSLWETLSQIYQTLSNHILSGTSTRHLKITYLDIRLLSNAFDVDNIWVKLSTRHSRFISDDWAWNNVYFCHVNTRVLCVESDLWKTDKSSWNNTQV